MLSAFMLKKIVWFTLILLVTISTVSGDASNLEITPLHPVVGDTIKIKGDAGSNEKLLVSIDFTKMEYVVNGEYEYVMDFENPQNGDYAITAEKVEKLNVGVKLLLWWTKTVNANENNIAQLSQTDVPGGNYLIKIGGTAASGQSSVYLKIKASSIIYASPNGKFKYSYSTRGLPAGTYYLNIGGKETQINLLSDGEQSIEEEPVNVFKKDKKHEIDDIGQEKLGIEEQTDPAPNYEDIEYTGANDPAPTQEGIENKGTNDPAPIQESIENKGTNDQAPIQEGIENKGANDPAPTQEGIENKGANDPAPTQERIENKGANDPAPIQERIENKGANDPAPTQERIENTGANDPAPTQERIENKGANDPAPTQEGLENTGANDPAPTQEGIENKGANDPAPTQERIENTGANDPAPTYEGLENAGSIDPAHTQKGIETKPEIDEIPESIANPVINDTPEETNIDESKKDKTQIKEYTFFQKLISMFKFW